ncbi:MAG: peroxiredoxin [Cyanobacteriota bacterium]|nr:peroxiredoxin [Cyanobacteriota bacterium]
MRSATTSRRRLLEALVAVPAALLVAPRAASALGGDLPPLDAPAPAFRLDGVAPDGSGVSTVTLSLDDFRGRWLVLYLYPRDFTSGCTLEARGFQRDLQRFEARNSAVVGVSADDGDSHASFCSEEGLAFPLLSDPGGMVSRAFGSWISPFSQRHTFLIDPQGQLRARWTAVRPSGHSGEVLAELERLQA